MPPIDEEATAKRTAITTGSGPNPARPAEEVLVSVRRVSCDGVGGALGYIELGEDGVAECGYCDRRFVLVGHEKPESEQLAPGVYEGASGH